MPNFLKIIKTGFLTGFSFGLIIGLILSFYLLKLNFHLTFLFFCSFAIILMVYYGFISTIFGTGLSILIYIIILLIQIKPKKRKISFTVFMLLIAFSFFFKERHIFPSLPFDFLSPMGILVNLLIIAIIFLLSYWITFLLFFLLKKGYYKFLKKHKLLALFLFLFSFYLIYQAITSLATPELMYDPYQEIIPLETNEKVIFIGVDGVPRQLLEPLIEQGKLPNFQKLIETGSYANKFKTATPKSPIVWTIMATGKKKSKNGISDFYKTKLFYSEQTINALIDGVTLRTLFNKLEKFGFSGVYTLGSKDRIAKTIWNILSENNKTVTIIGYPATWPAEVVNGFLTVYNLGLYKQKTDGKITYLKENLIHPDSLLKELEEYNLIIRDQEIGIEEMSEFIDTTHITKDFSISKTLKETIASDKTNANIALHLLKKKQTDYFFIYIGGLDSVQHIFWKHKEPNHFYPKFFSLFFNPVRFIRPEENERKIYKDTIEKYYQYVDRLLGEILEHRDENTTIIIASDNGQRYAHHMYPFPGILIINGKNIKQNTKLSYASIYDLTPTILYLLGLPLAEDMDGKILTEAIKSDFLKEFPISYIPTYEDEPRGELKSKVIKEDIKIEEEMEKLKSLGYIT